MSEDTQSASNAIETEVSKRIGQVVNDLHSGRVGTTDRGALRDALQRSDRNASLQRAITGGIGGNF